MSGRLRRAAHALRLRAEAAFAARSGRYGRGSPAGDGLQWLFLATLPNAGSTALAAMLATAPAVRMLERHGEGQWLVPEMSVPRARWDPALPLDYDRIRAVWLYHARRRGPGPALVLEKSPANIVRLPALMAAFSDMETRLVILTRDPLAVCASWAGRYTPERLRREWLYDDRLPLADEADFYRGLGTICGTRLGMLAEMRGRADHLLSYEALTADPGAELARLAPLSPLLAGADAAAALRVKDYAAQPLRNMNAEQIGRLSPEQAGWIRAGLAPHAAALAAFGYTA